MVALFLYLRHFLLYKLYHLSTNKEYLFTEI